MKAIVIREFRGPEVLRWEEVPTPTPGPAEILVRVHASNCVPISDGLSFVAATLIARHFPLAFGEASLAHHKAGDWVLVMGAAGGYRSQRDPC